MNTPGIETEHLPQLNRPLLIAGFDGWGNALKISSGMAGYLIRRFGARPFARLVPDAFYRYDETRPLVRIEQGVLSRLVPPGGSLFAARTGAATRDLVILKADEPSIRWYRFVEELLAFCSRLKVETIITLGSMYDSVLHTDRIVSGLASSAQLFDRLKQKNIRPISYRGPSAIHSVIQWEGARMGFQCISLWTHCPYYLQGTTHFGILSHLGGLLSFLGGFELDTADLENSWKTLNEQIQQLIKNNAELQSLVSKLRKEKVRGFSAALRPPGKTDEKVINLKDFLEPK